MPAMPFAWGAGRRLRARGLALAAAALSLAILPAPARAQVVQISNLTDISFGAIGVPSADLSLSQTVCAYATGLPPRYAIKASGSGVGGAFTLTTGAATLAYEVQWNAAAGQTSGTGLSAGVNLTGQASGGVTPTCTLGLTPSGSLTVILRAADMSSATAGSYSGTLTLLLSPN